jgi:hypothetical protein
MSLVRAAVFREKTQKVEEVLRQTESLCGRDRDRGGSFELDLLISDNVFGLHLRLDPAAIRQSRHSHVAAASVIVKVSDAVKSSCTLSARIAISNPSRKR